MTFVSNNNISIIIFRSYRRQSFPVLAKYGLSRCLQLAWIPECAEAISRETRAKSESCGVAQSAGVRSQNWQSHATKSYSAEVLGGRRTDASHSGSAGIALLSVSPSVRLARSGYVTAGEISRLRLHAPATAALYPSGRMRKRIGV